MMRMRNEGSFIVRAECTQGRHNRTTIQVNAHHMLYVLRLQNVAFFNGLDRPRLDQSRTQSNISQLLSEPPVIRLGYCDSNLDN